jgi:hypothetical protein
MPREGKTASLSTSLRGALATKQSIPPFARLDGLLRGACHPAALCADRVARNDPEGACHVLCVIACECDFSVRALPSLEYWIARSRLRQGFAAAPLCWRAEALAKAASRAMTGAL